MANFNDPAAPNAEELGLLHGMGFDCISMPRKRHLKELARPPVDLFASSSGLYIPPEETQTDVPLDDFNGWGFTDDEQNDTDDEDMDDNEYDTDFAEADFPPPVEMMEDAGQRTFENVPPLFYDTPQQSIVYSNLPSPFINQREDSNSMYMNELPVRFVDPSSLHLSNQHLSNEPKIFNDNSSPDTVTLHSVPASSSIAYPEINNASTTNAVAPHIQDPKQLEIGMGDFDMDLDLDDLYAPIVDEFTQYDQQQQQQQQRSEQPTTDVTAEPQNAYTPIPPHNLSGVAMPQPTSSVPSILTHDNALLPAPMKENSIYATENRDTFRNNEYKSSPVDSLNTALSTAPVSPATQEHIPSPPMSPVYEKPRRKPTTRRKARTSHGAQHAGVHVCTMKYPDGAECNRSFTRPYDLARHQETLHAAVRKTYTCEACGSKSKTFSRLDALSRHMRLKHS